MNEDDVSSVVFMCDHDDKTGLIPFKCYKCNGFWCNKCLINKFHYTKTKVSKLSLKKEIFTCPRCVLKAIDDKKNKAPKNKRKRVRR